MSEDPLARPRSYEWRRRLYRFAIWQFLYRGWFRLHVHGWENIPADGPVLMVGNHMAALDPVVMISFFPGRDIVPMAKIESYAERGIRVMVRNWGAIPVNRGEADRRALKRTIDLIQSGQIGMLYVEGTRSKTGMIPGQEGSVYLALKSGAILVPVAIWGTRDFPGRWWRDFRRVDVHVSFGRPFRFREEEGRLPRESFRRMTDEMSYRIAELLPPEWRGCYAELDQATCETLDLNPSYTPLRLGLPRHVRRVPG